MWYETSGYLKLLLFWLIFHAWNWWCLASRGHDNNEVKTHSTKSRHFLSWEEPLLMDRLMQLFHFIQGNSKPNGCPTCELKLFLKHSGFGNMWIKIKDFPNPNCFTSRNAAAFSGDSPGHWELLKRSQTCLFLTKGLPCNRESKTRSKLSNKILL